LKNTLLLAAALSCLSVPAFAQTQPTPRTGGYVAGIGGMTFGTETSTLFGGEVGVGVTPSLTVYGTAGRMQNIAPKYVNDTLDAFSGLLTLSTGDLYSFKANAPTFFGIGGVKYRIPTSGSVRPYVLGGAGVGSVKVNVSERTLGNITDILVSEGVFNESDFKKTSFVFETGGGVEIPVGAIYVDAGYRFGRFVQVEDANVSRAYAGVGYRFGGSTK
jgi:outer membrane protein with beta-barrel domain